MFERLRKPDVRELERRRDAASLVRAVSFRGDALVRAQAARALGALRVTDATKDLLNALWDEDAHVRRAACDSLGLLGDATVACHVAQALGDDDEGVRLAAVNALGALGSQEGLPGLARALCSPDPRIRRATVEAVARIGGKDAAEILRRTWGHDESPEIQEAARIALHSMTLDHIEELASRGRKAESVDA